MSTPASAIQITAAQLTALSAPGGSLTLQGPTPAGGTPTVNPSPSGTIIVAPSTAAITDAAFNVWTINAAKQVAVNGTADTTTANVAKLAYVNGTVWQKNTAGYWYGKTAPGAAWSEPGTTTAPIAGA